ncbi:3-hydroxyacyl-ACP dehydratase FabZ family protein [Pedobacter mucosus]|uniref:3-hydroxyacyl-ACP dehydratase FabZ family protein n=1 Tax=Pedobacter mucosus TaxID=2895286 RepID=UPI001EE3B51B|nr:3-hydroxyacyl-ACP dehydratase FabZ family protein [Pedobacter mucosus]UKT62829.1 beta-hydroxyacyl-ACP dehydratase [Pedobacter mucosus]
MTSAEILKHLPYGKPFLFVDELLSVSETGAKGSFTFDENLDFYKGHFKDNPVTPAVILIETMAQIGLVCLGIYLTNIENQKQDSSVAMTSSAVDFLKPVFPGEKVTVTSEKIYFRFNKLSCNVKMENSKNETVCIGKIEGMLFKKP